MSVDHRPQLERTVTRTLRVMALLGVAWVALCGAGGAYLVLYLTQPKEPSC